MIKMSPSIWVFLVLIVCLSTSCSSGVPATASNPLKVEWTLWQGDFTLLVADQMGFFSKAGVDVEPIQYDSATQAIPDLAGAKLDGGLFTMSDALLGSNLVDIRAVMASDDKGEYSIVASPEIQSVSDLRGKRIGFNLHTSAEMFVTDMLKTERMTPNDVSFVEMSPNQVSQNIPGEIDAGLVWEPYTTQALQQGKVIVYQSTYESSLTPKLIVFRNAVVMQRPQDIRAFILAWDEAIHYRLSHPQESLAIISKATGLSASDLNATGNITFYTTKENIAFFSNTAGTDPSSIFFIAGVNRDFLISAGYLTNPVHFNILLDPSFLK